MPHITFYPGPGNKILRKSRRPLTAPQMLHSDLSQPHFIPLGISFLFWGIFLPFFGNIWGIFGHFLGHFGAFFGHSPVPLCCPLVTGSATRSQIQGSFGRNFEIFFGF